MSTLKSKPPKEAFLAGIKERFRLNPGSEKETYHIVLNLEGSGIEYSVGDCIGIYPQNDPLYVDQLINAIGEPSLYPFLLKKANLARIPKKLLGEYPDLLTLLQNQKVDPLVLQEKLLPLLPRFYSIASSRSHVGAEIHLTVALTGICSDYLCRRAPLHVPEIPLFLQPSPHFSLSLESQEKPLIMIGPGTGVAPFRGFMQERRHSRNWLFFGEKYEKTDFYYRSFWESLVAAGRLQLDCAFSRDQEEKIYVQHKMLARGKELWKWLEEGAYLYVCGDASEMAKDVDKALHQVVETEGNKTSSEAKAYIKNLKQLNRYQRDIY